MGQRPVSVEWVSGSALASNESRGYGRVVLVEPESVSERRGPKWSERELESADGVSATR